MKEQKMNFTLEGKELEKAKKWIKKQKKIHGENIGTIGDRFSYIFTPTGIGVGITILDGLTQEKKDVTNYDNW